MKPNINKLIEKYINGSISKEEIAQLEVWLHKDKNKYILKKEIQLNHLIQTQLLDFNAKKPYENAVKRVQNKPARGVRNLRPIMRYAAIFIGVLGLGYWMLNENITKKTDLIIPDEQITLLLEDGAIQVINHKENNTLIDERGDVFAAQKGDTLQYTSVQNQEALVFNTLHVPNGKTFKLQLSDGTHVYLNSGSELKFPKVFMGKERKVYLKGEAYFDVTRNEQVPFIVNAQDMDITVLGTKFNVSVYNNNPKAFTVLVEGVIALNANNSVILKPNQMALWGTNSEVHVMQVDVKDYIAWMDGKVVFNKKTFKDILHILERKYNIIIDNQYPNLNDQRYQGTFSNETIQDILETFKESRLFDYHISDNKVVITSPK